MDLEILSGLSAVASSKTFSKAEFFKLLVNIDKQLFKEAGDNGQALNGLSGANDFAELDKSLSTIINSNISDADIDNAILKMVNSDLQGLGDVDFLGALKIRRPAKKVAAAVKKVVKKAVKLVHKAVTLPARLLTKLLLKAFRGKVSKNFVYAFLPNNSPLIAKNPEVKRKSLKQKNFIKLLSKGAAFPPDYLLKHIRNDIQKTYKKTPEAVIQDMINKKDADLRGLGELGSAAAIAAAIAAFIPVLAVVPTIVKTLNFKKDLPASSDVVSPVTINMPDPTKPDPKQPDPEDGMSTTEKVLIGTALVSIAAGGIYLATKKKKKKNK